MRREGLLSAVSGRVRRGLDQLREDLRGVSALEFAVAGPVMLILVIGILDLGQMLYVSALLRGAVQQVARDATLETAETDDLDAFVTGIVGGIAPGSTVDVSRKSYYDFSDVGRPETWNDSNNNDTCDNGETYTDENGNGQWDEDVGESGNGGASDAVLYTVTLTYKPIFPVPFLPGSTDERTISATAFKKNQPYALQADYGSDAGSCD